MNLTLLKDLSIRRKLLFGTLAICLTTLTLACSALFWFQSMTFRRGFVAELEGLGAVIAHNCAAPLAFADAKSAAEVLSAMKVKSYIERAILWDGEGKELASFGELEHRHQHPHNVSHTEGVAFDGEFACLSIPISVPDAKPGRLEIHAHFSEQKRNLIALYLTVVCAVLSGALLVILAMVSGLQRLISGPIIALADVARTVSEKEDYTSRAPVLANDEVGLLTRTFNRMLDQIESRDRSLRESQQRYEVAVLGSSDGLWDWDLVRNIVYFSPRWKAIIGYGEDELANAFDVFQSLLHPEDLEMVKNAVTDYLHGRDGMYEVEFRLRHKNGTYRWILSRGVALRDAAGKPVRFAGSHTDITERKGAENDLRVSREKFEILVNSIDGVVWEMDVKSSAITFVSLQAERLLGFPRFRWTEVPNFWSSRIHPEDRELTLCKRAKVRNRSEQLDCEYRMIAADGREVWVHEVAALSVGAGGEQILRGVLYDVTEQKLAAREMEALNRRLIDASREAGMAEVATGVLHNVGNVLNSVNVSASVVQDRLKESKVARLGDVAQLLKEHEGDMAHFLGEDPKGRLLPGFLMKLTAHLGDEREEAIRELGLLTKNIEHIKEIVAMQQNYAKVSGVSELLSPVQVVEDVLRMNEAGCSRHGIEVIREFGEVPVMAMDKHKVMQIVVNLVRNAKHALTASAREDKRLTVRVRAAANDQVTIEVQDNGVGIAPENLTKIFGHGFTTKKEGHGFGLHSGALAAREMGGNLTVSSEGIGFGATFSLTLPVHQTKKVEAEESQAA